MCYRYCLIWYLPVIEASLNIMLLLSGRSEVVVLVYSHMKKKETAIALQQYLILLWKFWNKILSIHLVFCLLYFICQFFVYFMLFWFNYSSQIIVLSVYSLRIICEYAVFIMNLWHLPEMEEAVVCSFRNAVYFTRCENVKTNV